MLSRAFTVLVFFWFFPPDLAAGVSSPGTTLPAAPTASRRATCWGRAGRPRTDSTRGHSWRVGSVGRSDRSRRSQAPDPALLSRRQCLRVGQEKDRGKENWREPFGEALVNMRMNTYPVRKPLLHQCFYPAAGIIHEASGGDMCVVLWS